MDIKDEEFVKKLLATFRGEATEHLSAISSGLIELERASSDERRLPIVESIFREVHSLKGAARSVSLAGMESACRALENIFAALKSGKLAVTVDLLDLLHEAADLLNQVILPGDMDEASRKKRINDLILRLEGALKGSFMPEGKREKAPAEVVLDEKEEKVPAEETVRISTSKIDSILLQAEEMLYAKLAAIQRTVELRRIQESVASLRKDASKDTQRYVVDMQRRIELLAKMMERDQRSMSGMLDGLLGDVKELMMSPFSTLLAVFPKMVRDLSRERRKEVELAFGGEDIRVDRRILDEMKDPLIHLVRNCIDHGIEDPEERVKKNKTPLGKITISISQKDSGKVEILISDDGKGLDTGKIRTTAVKVGLISSEDADKMSVKEVESLIFASGLSTSPLITDISGRGLGLAIVREKAEKLGGSISVETVPGAGTAFRIMVPVTVATFRGLIVGSGGSRFVIPTLNVERMIRVDREDIKTVENRETIQFNDKAVSLVRLDDVLERPGRISPVREVSVLILSLAERRIAFIVDGVIGEQEVLVKGMGSLLARVRNVAGAAILGSGEIAVVLNVADIMMSAVSAAGPPLHGPAEHATETKSILLVEDSITARTLLRGILGAAGYDVKTSVDGLEGFTMLKGGKFDLVVSDVDMPRMNGFDLTEKIRADARLANLPVVLVTALESQEDRERGMEAGANAYIVKSSFDQGNLLGAVRRLI